MAGLWRPTQHAAEANKCFFFRDMGMAQKNRLRTKNSKLFWDIHCAACHLGTLSHRVWTYLLSVELGLTLVLNVQLRASYCCRIDMAYLQAAPGKHKIGSYVNEARLNVNKQKPNAFRWFSAFSLGFSCYVAKSRGPIRTRVGCFSNPTAYCSQKNFYLIPLYLLANWCSQPGLTCIKWRPSPPVAALDEPWFIQSLAVLPKAGAVDPKAWWHCSQSHCFRLPCLRPSPKISSTAVLLPSRFFHLLKVADIHIQRFVIVWSMINSILVNQNLLAGW